MNDARRARLQQMLEDHRRRVQRNLSARLHDLRDCNDSGKVVGALDDAEASDSGLQQEFGIAMVEMAAETLRLVDRALERLASGTYGSCVECDEQIADKRLAAMPFALRCRECEELRETDTRRSPGSSAARSLSLLADSAVSRWARADQRE